MVTRRAVEAVAVLAGTVVRITRRPFRSALRGAPGVLGAAGVAVCAGKVAGHYAVGLTWWVALGVAGVFGLWFGAEVNRVPPVPPAELGRVVTRKNCGVPCFAQEIFPRRRLVGVFTSARPRGRAVERRALTFISPPVGAYTQALEDRSAGDPEGALRSAAVWFCANKISYSMAMMRAQTYRGPGPGDQGGVPAVKTPVPSILTRPSAAFTGSFAWTYGEWISLQLRGNAWGLILGRDKLGYPTQIELQHPDTVRVRTNSKGVREIRVNNELVDPADVWHTAIHVMPGADLGMSTIKYAATTTRTTQAAEAFGLSYFEDGAHPSAVLTNKNANKISQEQAQSVKEKFVAALHGTREPIVMAGGWDYQQIQISPQDSQFLQLMDAKGADITRFFGMMPVMAGYGTPGGSLTYQNVEQSTMDFLGYPMTPWIIQQEEWLTDLIPRGQYVKLDTSPLLRTDLLSRMRAYHMMIGSRAWTQDEVRALEDYAPLTPEQKAEVDALVMPMPPPVAGPRAGE